MIDELTESFEFSKDSIKILSIFNMRSFTLEALFERVKGFFMKIHIHTRDLIAIIVLDEVDRILYTLDNIRI